MKYPTFDSSLGFISSLLEDLALPSEVEDLYGRLLSVRRTLSGDGVVPRKVEQILWDMIRMLPGREQNDAKRQIVRLENIHQETKVLA